jgi:hypothetical protein
MRIEKAEGQQNQFEKGNEIIALFESTIFNLVMLDWWGRHCVLRAQGL